MTVSSACRDNPRDRQEGFVMREKVRTSDNNALPLSSSLPGLTAIQTDKKVFCLFTLSDRGYMSTSWPACSLPN